MSHLQYLLWLDGSDVNTVDPASLLIVLWSLFFLLTGLLAYVGYRRGWSSYVVSWMALQCAVAATFLFLARQYV